MNDEWPKVKLADVAEQCLGKMLDANKNKGHLMPYLRNPNVRWFDVDTSNLKLMRFEDHEHERYGLKAGDIVICEGGEAGRAAIWDGRLPDLKFQKAIHRVRPGSRLHNRFFVHRLMADHQGGRLGDYLTGATIKHFTGQDLARYEFPLPPLAEQRWIAEVLDRVEALRAKRRAALAQLDSLSQSIFMDAFGDPLTNPKCIKTAKLGSLCIRVTDGTHQPPKWSAKGHPFLFVSNIISGEITFDTEKFISDETHAELTRRCPIELGDVLYSTVGSYGVPAIVRSERKFAFQRHIAHLKPERNLLNSEFLAAMLASLPLKRQADRAAKGVAQKTVNLSEIREFVVFQPPLPLQREFSRRITVVEKLKAVQRASLAEMDMLFATLQNHAFNGKL